MSSPSERSPLPRLRRPILIAAFSGWNDAGDAASATVEHLALTWDAVPLTEIEPDDYYDYQATRPTVRQISGVTRRIDWPVTSLSYCLLPSGDRDVVLVAGPEPNLRWRAFCDEIVTLALELDIEIAVTLGALLADTPHTRPVPVSGSAETAEAAERYNLTQSRYEGPTGITGVLQDAFVRAGVPAVSLWAAVPHYVSSAPSPKSALALLTRLEEVLDLRIPLGNLPGQSVDWEQTVNEMIEDDEEITEYVRELEQRGDEELDITEAMSKVDGDELAAEFERYLRRRGNDAGN